MVLTNHDRNKIYEKLFDMPCYVVKISSYNNSTSQCVHHVFKTEEDAKSFAEESSKNDFNYNNSFHNTDKNVEKSSFKKVKYWASIWTTICHGNTLKAGEEYPNVMRQSELFANLESCKTDDDFVLTALDYIHDKQHDNEFIRNFIKFNTLSGSDDRRLLKRRYPEV